MLSIAASVIARSLLPAAQVVAGLAVAYGIANLVGAIAGWALLLRRVGSLDGWTIARSLTRMHLATVPGLVFALAVMAGAGMSCTTRARPTAWWSPSSAVAARSRSTPSVPGHCA